MNLTRRHIASAAGAVFVSVLAFLFQPDGAGNGDVGPWYSVLPPVIAIAMAFATGNVMLSLGTAIVVGGLLVTVPGAVFSISAWVDGLDTGAGYVGTTLGDSFNQQLLAFTVLTLTMISVVVTAGGLHGVVQWLGRFAKGPKSAQVVTYLMGLFFFIDDYANTMIVGNAMRTVTDTYRVSREKLAFLVDATSAPVAGTAIVSTWVGYEVGLFGEAAATLGIDATGYGMLFDALPFRFYCILMLVFVILSVVIGGDFGPMRRAEKRARETGALVEEDAIPMTSATFEVAAPENSARVRAITAILPIGFLISFLLAGIWVDGGGLQVLRDAPGSMLKFTTWRDVISASENSVKILAYGAGISLLIGWACARLVGGLSHQAIRAAMATGFRGSLLPVVILVCAWSLKGACDGLSTGPFLVALFGDGLNPAIFPAVVFIIAALTSFATGTSYGTMAILMPTAVPVAFALEGDAYGLITIITLGSILDGSIFGDHCSPISDTTILSSIASNCDHMHHVRTQIPYSLTVGGLALVCGYVPAGMGLPSWVSFAIAIAAMTGLLMFVRGRHRVPTPA